ncbi:MAG: TRAM domain-containing protein [Candidatus Nanopelagicales bacterium]
MSAEPAVGAELVVTVGPVAHGGHCVARHAGRVLFVRHGLPGEQVRVRITGVGRKGRFLRADVVEVLAASADRRSEPCPVAGDCGGCDWQHATPAASRELKAAVVAEALDRFAGITLDPAVVVAAVPLDPAGEGADPEPGGAPSDGLGWRTRGTLSVDTHGRAGFLAHRSHRVVATDRCPQLHPRLSELDLFTRTWSMPRVGFVAPATGAPQAFDATAAPESPITERAAGRSWAVAADGFWQVHPGAADALVGHVGRMIAARAGEHLVDLYGGVGLFGVSLAAAVDGLRVTVVEGDRRACALAELNAEDLPVTVVRAGVARWVARPEALAGADLVVLDPPRTGAGAEVVAAIAAARPRAVAYVACDPVALARDLATFRAAGMVVAELVALDLFPTTHHVECVAHLIPA